MRLYLLHAAYEALSQNIRPEENDPLRHIHLIAKDEAGQTVTVIVKGWYPYFYVKVPNNESAEAFSKSLTKEAGGQYLKQKHFSNIISKEVVYRKQFVGFTNNKDQKYVMLRTKRWPVWPNERIVLETEVKPQHKFFHETRLKSGSWFEMTGAEACFENDSVCKRGDVYFCKVGCLKPLPELATPPNLTVCAYDLETTGLDPATSKIHQVCLIYWNTNQDVPETGKDPRSVVICTQPTSSVNGTRVQIVKDEEALFLACD
jgi:DNA polymerase elongation subunit (family B)